MASSGFSSECFSLVQFGVKKEDLVRLLMKSLDELGYKQSSKMLEEESGLNLLPLSIQSAEEKIIQGEWDDALSFLSNCTDCKKTSFLVYRQEYFESLESSETTKILKCLQKLAPFSSPDELRKLSSLLLCRRDLKERAGCCGMKSRIELWKDISKLLPSSLFIPENRLEYLLTQAFQYQMDNCHLYNLDSSLSLFEDCNSNGVFLPTHCIAILDQHQDEIWIVKFSPDGTKMATASKDHTVIIWNVSENDFTLQHRLCAHTNAISAISWSPNSKMLLSGSNDFSVILWDIQDGIIIRTFNEHSQPVTDCSWLSCGTKFITGSLDKQVILWNIDGSTINTWTLTRVHGFVLDSDSRLVVVCSDNKIRILDLNSEEEISIEEKSPTSICISQDGFIAVNRNGDSIKMWDINQRVCVNEFSGHRQSRYIVHSTFGGVCDSFIASGSEDSQVYIWHRKSAKLLVQLSGHSSTVNDVAWCPTNPHLLASVSDDHTVRIWGLPPDTNVNSE